MTLRDTLRTINDQNLAKIQQATNLKELNEIRVGVLGKKSPITNVLRGMKDLKKEDRPVVGQFANEIRDGLVTAIDNQKAALEQKRLDQKLAHEKLDVTLPGTPVVDGTPHVLMQVMEDLEDVFMGMGFQIVRGYEVEDEHHNFEMLNMPKDHPARDMQDTFYITQDVLMRTHMSPNEARELEEHDFSEGPIKMIGPGKVYRRDTDDATHSHQFFQMEGQVIDKHITMADLKGTLEYAIHSFFGADREIRFRPSYFPFTEPSIEVDISCFNCNGKGCAVCKYTGWIEVLGAGMTHPNVLKAAHVDADVYGGFAFGLGIDRFAMLKYGITDIRQFYQNDIRFLSQFNGEDK
ncbi:phenylalanine--tRNA ligase subunit alpha [Lactobacillus selangorensis]|nr:phenylalanine--tRNA ligase subunit alpha [Lactobacillus selangorensis]